MDKYIFDENNGLWYEQAGDYYFPYLTAPAEEEQPVGIWGQRHKKSNLRKSCLENPRIGVLNKKIRDFLSRNDIVYKMCFQYNKIN